MVSTFPFPDLGRMVGEDNDTDVLSEVGTWLLAPEH